MTPVNILISKDTSGFYAEASFRPGFGSFDGPTSIFATSDTIEATIKEILDAISLTFEDDNMIISRNDLNIKLDIPSFFEFYKVINVKALSLRLGMNQSLLSQYINGQKKPSSKQTSRILEGIRKLGRELTEVDLC